MSWLILIKEWREALNVSWLLSVVPWITEEGLSRWKRLGKKRRPVEPGRPAKRENKPAKPGAAESQCPRWGQRPHDRTRTLSIVLSVSSSSTCHPRIKDSYAPKQSFPGSSEEVSASKRHRPATSSWEKWCYGLTLKRVVHDYSRPTRSPVYPWPRNRLPYSAPFWKIAVNKIVI